MKKKHSQYLEDPDKYLLKRERRVILSEGKPNEEKEKDDNEEEEEYWDYEDGGQSMEELDRLERLEELMKKFQGRGQKANLFNLWKNKGQEKFRCVCFYREHDRSPRRTRQPKCRWGCRRRGDSITPLSRPSPAVPCCAWAFRSPALMIRRHDRQFRKRFRKHSTDRHPVGILL